MSIPRYNPMPWGPQTSSEHGEDPATSPSTSPPGYTLPTDVATLHSMINTLLELQATTSVNTHLAACLARLPTATTATTSPTTAAATTTAVTAPVACPHPNHTLTIASGRGAASPEVFKQITKTNWHGRLGRAHMVDVDALPATSLAELDCLLRRRLHAIFPRGGAYSVPEADTIFASLAALGLWLEDREAYADVPDTAGSELYHAPMVRRGRDLAAWYYAHGKYADYWRGFAVETLVELARYRGLFDDEGFLRVE